MMPFIKDITEFIFLEERPETADVILVPGNTWPQPAERAAALYRDGLAPLVIVSGKYSKGSGAFPGPSCEKDRYNDDYRTEAEFLSDVLQKNGVPASAIRCDQEAEFTLENAVNIRRILETDGRPFQRAVICCQAFHARRCRMYFEYVFWDTDMKFFVCPANTRNITKENWMQTNRGRATVLGELKRCGEQFGWMLAPDDDT